MIASGGTGSRQGAQRATAAIVSCLAGLAVLVWTPVRAAETALWTPNPLVAVFEGPDYSDKHDGQCAVRIIAARNGYFVGQVVLHSREPIRGPVTTVTDLRRKGGGGIIPASAVEVRYALPTNTERGAEERFPGFSSKDLRRFDALAAEPQDQARTHPIWLKVKVPADAAAGDYEAELSVAGRQVPVHVKVCPWTLPEPIAYRTHIGIIQSPDTLAMKYDVPLWSDEHFRLIGRSFDYLGQVGNKTIFIPLICETHFGNSESMVRWIGRSRENPDQAAEKFTHDFSVFEKYLDLYIQRVGKPDVVCLYVWDHYAGGAHFGKDSGEPGDPIRVSRLDPNTGNVETMEGPVHGSPDSEAFWKPVMEGVRQRLHQRGVRDESILVGIGSDNWPNKATVDLFRKVAPYARWFVHAHSAPEKLFGVEVGYLAHVWGVGTVPDPDRPPDNEWRRSYYYGWNEPRLRTVFPRYGGKTAFLYPPMWTDGPLAVYRAISEAALAANLRGIGRVGADFWPVLPDPRSRRDRPLLNRYPGSNWHQLTVSNTAAALLHPGPDGPIPTVRFEMLREGVQEAEAKIFIEAALLDEDKRAALGPQTAQTCREVLKDRVRAILRAYPAKYQHIEPQGWQWYAAESDWQARSETLFETAAAVAQALAQSRSSSQSR